MNYNPTNTYTKPPKTFAEQVTILKNRGLLVSDPSYAEKILHDISYYRLSAYMLPFKKRASDGSVIDEFIPGSNFTTVLSLYQFDAALRLLVFSAIERIEISLRSQIIYQLSHKYGSHWTDNKTIFRHPITSTNHHGQQYTIDIYKTIQDHIKTAMQNADSEEFLRHYRATYVCPPTPPAWMTVETMYFSHLSLICKHLAHGYDRFPLANYYRLPIGTFNSWLHALNNVRNICAHHGRLWNRDINIVPELYRSTNGQKWLTNPTTVPRKKLYYTLCILQYLLQTADPAFELRQKIEKLFLEYPFINLQHMGFPVNWETEPIWN